MKRGTALKPDFSNVDIIVDWAAAPDEVMKEVDAVLKARFGIEVKWHETNNDNVAYSFTQLTPKA